MPVLLGIVYLLVLITSCVVVLWWAAGSELRAYLHQVRERPVQMIPAGILALGFGHLVLRLLLNRPLLGVAFLGAVLVIGMVVGPYGYLWWYEPRKLTATEWDRIDTQLQQEMERNRIRLRVRQEQCETSEMDEGENANATAIGLLPSSKYVFIDESLFSRMDDDDELSAILAHELAHHDHEDQLSAATGVGACFACLLAAGYGLPVVFGPKLLFAGIGFETWRVAVGLPAIIFFLVGLAVNREQEHQADLGAVDRMRDPALVKRALGTFLDESDHGLTSDFLSTHPTPRKRKERINDEYDLD